MAFNFRKLDSRTRNLMVSEIQTAISSQNLYFSTRFNDVGIKGWPSWLLAAANNHSETWLSDELVSSKAMVESESRATPKGGSTIAQTPERAALTVSEGQFNRFYMAAICLRAIEDGIESVQVYRATERSNPRAESESIEGEARDPVALLAELRSKGSSLRCNLLRPNSGLSVD